MGFALSGYHGNRKGSQPAVTLKDFSLLLSQMCLFALPVT